MKFHKSFHFRIFVSLWVFGILLVITYALLAILLSMTPKAISRHIYSEMKNELDYFNERFDLKGSNPLPQTRFLKTYMDLSHLPQEIQKKVAELGTGYHRFALKDTENNDRVYYVAVKEHPDTVSRMYIFYDYYRLENELKADFKNRAYRRFLLAFFIIVLLALFVGFATYNRIVVPLKKLTSLVKESDPEDLPVNLSKDFPNNEIGFLAVSLETAMRRISEFIEREKSFSRDSSHELRTPVTIIKGAVELIRQTPGSDNKAIDRPLHRIERAIRNMEVTIETFLWLGRENHETDREKKSDIKVVVENSVEENKYLISGKDVSVNIAIEDNTMVSAPEPVLKIAVVNLIRNAFYYTKKGKITIFSNSNYFEIADTGIGIKPDELKTIKEPHVKSEQSQGFGLGFAIVERLCKRFHWKFEIKSRLRTGTYIRMTFSEQNEKSVLR